MSRSHAASPAATPDRHLPHAAKAASLMLALVLAGCAQSRGTTTRSFNEPQRLSAVPRSAVTDDDEERPAPVPADPYKGVRYKGGRDPQTGAAGTLGSAQPGPMGAMGGITPGARPIGHVAHDRTTNVTPDGTVIEVKPGDTLYGIATRHRVSVAGIMKANNLASERIAPGQRLLLP